jgi:polyphosphate:AMP phosphotransferase
MLVEAEVGHRIDKQTYVKAVPTCREGLIDAQYELSRSRRFATIVLLTGVSSAGKSEGVNRLLTWMDPRYIDTLAIGRDETEEQRSRPYMWRFWQILPPRGRITILFEHWYTLPVWQHANGEISDAELGKRLAEINRFERMLTDEGILLVKFFLHITKKQLRQRLKHLASDPQTSWRVTEDDALYVKKYKPLMKSIEETLRLTSPGHAPWIVTEAADRRYRELTIGQSLLGAINARLDASAKPLGINRVRSYVPLAALDGRSVLSALDFAKCVASPRTYSNKLEALQGRLSQLIRDKRFMRHSLILAFEGCDAAGKGGTIRRVAQGIDPRLYRIVPIAKPSDDEAERPYLWRFWRHVPCEGRVTIFDRSWYGRVLVERVEALCPEADWRRAYGEINDFEADLVASGAIVVKFWLAITKEEQLRRFKDRERRPFKRFKITKEDWRNRERWADYEQAVVEMVARTSTDIAPWTLVESEDKSFAHLKALRTICERLEATL